MLNVYIILYPIIQLRKFGQMRRKRLKYIIHKKSEYLPIKKAISYIQPRHQSICIHELHQKKSFLLLLFILLGLNSTWGNDDISPVARALKGRTVNAKGASASVNEKAGYYVFIFSSIGCGPSIDLISGNSSTAWQKALKKSKVPTECIVVFLPGEHDFDDRVVNRLKKLDNPLPYPYLLPSHLPCRFYPNYTNGTPAIHVFDGKGREVPFSSRDPQELMAKLEEFDALPEGERTYIKPDTVQKWIF